MTEELWATIKEFPNYEISNLGRIHNSKDGRMMNISRTVKGHNKITLASDLDKQRYTRSVARLVAEAFVDKPQPSCDTVVVLDGDLFNTVASNLVWRPRWFAWKYTHQLGGDIPLYYYNLPIINTNTGEVYKNIIECGISEGLLFNDIWRSTYSGNPIFPTQHIYEVVPVHDRVTSRT